MACAVQGHHRHLEAGELKNDLDEIYFGTLPSSPSFLDADLDLPDLPTEEETMGCLEDLRLSAASKATSGKSQSFKMCQVCGSSGEGWWDDVELAPSVYKTLKERERSAAKIQYRSPQLLYREQLVTYMFSVGNQVRVCCGTMYFAVILMDQVMDKHNFEECKLKLLASVCLMLAAKLDDTVIPAIEWLLCIARVVLDPCIYTREDFQEMEIYILKFFNWSLLSFASPGHFVRYFLKHSPEWAQDTAPCLLQPSALHTDITNCEKRRMYYLYYANFFIQMGLKDCTFMKYSPSMLAAMSICAARVSLGLIDPWPFELQLVTSFSLDSIQNGVIKLLNIHPTDLPVL